MIDVSLKQLVCFLEVCRDFHFTNAAKRLNMSQPPLSRHIQELESTIGTKLFLRDGKRIQLTTAGELFLKESYQIPAILTRAKEAAQRADRGEPKRLRVGFVGALMEERLLALFKRFRESHHDTQLALSDLSPARLLEELEAGRLDGAFLGVLPRRNIRGLQSIPWKTEDLQVILPEGHPLSKKSSIDPEDLSSETLITLSEGVAPAFRNKLRRIFKRKLPPIGSETTGVPSILAMVIAGSGFSILPNSALGSTDPSLVSIKLKSKDAKLEQVFICKRMKGNETMQSFIALL